MTTKEFERLVAKVCKGTDFKVVSVHKANIIIPTHRVLIKAQWRSLRKKDDGIDFNEVVEIKVFVYALGDKLNQSVGFEIKEKNVDYYTYEDSNIGYVLENVLRTRLNNYSILGRKTQEFYNHL